MQFLRDCAWACKKSFILFYETTMKMCLDSAGKDKKALLQTLCLTWQRCLQLIFDSQ